MNLLFPFPEIRNGQKELINDIKNVLETKGTLIAHAPTGIGKTAAALNPALEYALNNDKIVFFLTSKQSQHKIVIDTLRIIKEKNKDKISFSVVDVISKQAMCPRDIAREYYALFNDLCTNDQKTKRCRYFRSDKNIIKHILGNIMHVEELKDFCAGNFICPHKAAIDAISEANIIICDYNYLFTDILETVLEKTHKSIGDLILIIDESHNLPDRLRDNLSGELTLNLIEEAAKEINPVDKKLYRHLKDAGRFFDNFIRRMPGNTEKNINREDITAGVEQVLQESLGDNISYLEFVGALKDAGVELAEKKQYEEKKKSSVISVMEFLENWNTLLPCSRVYKNNPAPTLSFRLLDPSVLSESIISNAHASILMSGTLYPVEMYADILGAKHSLLRQYESPFPSENKIVLVTKKLTTLYTERNDSMYGNIAEKISKIHDAVKGNIAVFFPSYSLMDEIYKKFESHPDFEIRNKTSDIILEKKDMSKSAKDELYSKLKINSNKILMGVQAGSLSEGVDYRNNIIHAVLIVGLPLSPPTLEVKNLQDYYIKKFGKEKGTLYGYIYPAISKVIQAAGRGIRSENDVGAIILMDYRFNYPMYRKCLPPDYKIQFTDEPEKLCREFFGKDLVLKALEDTKKRFIEEEELKQMKEEKHILAESKSEAETKSETEKQQIQETIPERSEEKTENNDNPGLNILGLVETLNFSAGRSLLADILTGSKSKKLINQNINKSEYYGMLKRYTREEVINIIDQIIDKGYLVVKQSETTNFPRPLLYLTELGKNALDNDNKIEVKFPIKIKDGTGVLEVSKNPELLNELKFWRKNVAKEENIPAYCIFHDTTLIEISNSLPSSISDLMNIRGFGKKTIEKYGDDVLKIVKEHISHGNKLYRGNKVVSEIKVRENQEKEPKEAEESPTNTKPESSGKLRADNNLTVDRIGAEHKLKEIFGLGHFYDIQWKTIKKILDGERILLIEKTGFGKSLCYQFPATQFEGTTIVFSPLIALMRNQVKKLNELGIKAKCINSEQTPEENSEIIEEAKQDKIKILYIAPKRQENIEWIEAARQMNLSMVVIDEAHCISVWGHDFRPSFKRIINLVNLLPENFPVLATTATATKRVEEDIVEQIGNRIISLRGNLLRENFYLKVIKVESDDEKLAWLGENINSIQGSGIIYTGTRTNTEIYSRWLQSLGVSSVAYNAGLDAESRKHIEQGLMNNTWKCVVSTNALGMGIDKPDIRFIIHTQIPASPIHYYQEIGRAGRDGKPTNIILLYGRADIGLPKSFIESSKPSADKYQRVIDALKSEPLGEYDIMRETNLNLTQVRVIKAELIDQKIINEVYYNKSKKYELKINTPELDYSSFEELIKTKFAELDKMVEYAETRQCRMRFLCDYLGDSKVEDCEKCDNDSAVDIHVKLNEYWNNEIQEFNNNYFPDLPVESIGKMINGVAAAYYGFLNVGTAIHRCKYENGGDFPDFLLRQTLKAFKKKFNKDKFDLLVYVPPTKSGDLVKNFAEKISCALNIPISHKLKKIRDTKHQKIFQNRILKRDNVKDAFEYENPRDIEGKSILIVDDVFDSGHTIKEIGRYFTKLGAVKIAPLTISKTIGCGHC